MKRRHWTRAQTASFCFCLGVADAAHLLGSVGEQRNSSQVLSANNSVMRVGGPAAAQAASDSDGGRERQGAASAALEKFALRKAVQIYL